MLNQLTLVDRTWFWADKHKKLMPWLVFLVAFCYYVALSAKSWTWIFVSGDSGDWLASSIWWFVPQPMGSPLFLVLGHILDFFKGDLVLKETILLSCLPAAVTVALIYSVTLKLVGKQAYALLASLMLLGAGLFLTQSTVIEEYALASMLVVLSYYFYLKDRQNLSVAALGLGVAVHVVVLPIALLWLYVERARWKQWLRCSWLFVLCGIVPYLLIPWMMMLESPPLITGYWSFANLKEYLFNTSGVIVGQISVFDFPVRLLRFLTYILAGLGLGLVGLLWAYAKPVPKHILLIFAVLGFIAWYYLTNLDPSTWTFLVYTMPFLAVLAAIGLSKAPHKVLVRLAVISSLLLVLFNSYWLNADLLTRAEPVAMQYKQSLEATPVDSAVLLRQGAYSLGLYYTMADSRPDLAPIIFYEGDSEVSSWNSDYTSWLSKEFKLIGSNPSELIANTLAQGRHVYIAEDLQKIELVIIGNITGMEHWTELLSRLTMTDGEGNVREITGIK